MRMCEFQLPVGMHLFYKFPTALDLLKCSKPCSLVFHPQGGIIIIPRGGKLPKLASCIKAKRKILNITAANL